MRLLRDAIECTVATKSTVMPSISHTLIAFSHEAFLQILQVMMPDTQSPVRMRVGIHTGDCVSGLIGTKLPK